MKKIYYLLGLVGMLGFSAVVFGNAGFFGPTASTSSGAATTTPVYMVAASATQATTTPVVYDTYGIDGTNENAGQTSDASDSVALLEYVNASSTATIFRTNIEYSDGSPGVSCVATPTLCNWYENNLDTYAAGVIAIQAPNTYSWTYASSSPGQGNAGGLANDFRGAKIIGLKVPTRYVRAFVSVSGANGSVSLKFVPKKQRVN